MLREDYIVLPCNCCALASPALSAGFLPVSRQKMMASSADLINLKLIQIFKESSNVA
jgi:hypothetical protein